MIRKKKVAETLNQFFVNIGPILLSNIATSEIHSKSYVTSNNISVMSNPKLTENELSDTVSLFQPIKNMKPNTKLIRENSLDVEDAVKSVLKGMSIRDKAEIYSLSKSAHRDAAGNDSFPYWKCVVTGNYIQAFKQRFLFVNIYRHSAIFIAFGFSNVFIVKMTEANSFNVFDISERKDALNRINDDDKNMNFFDEFSQSKKNYYSSLLNKTFGNARKTWNVIKEITGVGIVKSDNLPKRLQRDDNRGDAFVNKEIAETFNSFFINIGKKLAGAIPEGKKSFKFFLKKSDSFMEESELLIDELRLAISMLKTNKSAGLDEVNPDVVKAVSDNIEKPLFKIFNLSLKNGIFPDQLKLAKIIPIYKGGDDSIKSNYRPISILSCFSKILERIMHNSLYNYLEKNNILYHKQFGFCNNHSTEHAVIDLANQILNGFDNDSYTLGIFLDLSKAFDTVNHKILIYKLHNYGVVHSNLKWLQCYLQNCKQGVPYDLTSSPFESINCGVPQGSILGPLLINIS
ncbi:uncharacterized protein LOC136074031 [Hydra vulgaris]|uniref:Uncharacterized protein LOC136074031 n=1 Tax=Hydra vulgaris TaxID=6087 RepID=A0ABM4B0U1_HYDVU